MSYFDTIAPQLAAGAFNPQMYNPWMGVPALPKSQENAGARPSYISSNTLPIQQMNALTNIGTAASENNLRSYQAQQAALNTQFLQQRLNAFPEFMKSLEGGMGGGAPLGAGMTAPGGGGYSTPAETGSPAPSASTSAGSGGGSGFGPLAGPVVDQLRSEGWTDPAIAGALANGQAEGQFNEPWQKSAGKEQSFGHWQFNDKGELPGYLDFVNSVGGDPQDSKMQARYLASRMEELVPGFGQITDPKLATNLIESEFEKPGKQTSRMGQLMLAQNYLAKNPAAPGPQYAQADTGTATDATPDMGVRRVPPGTPVNSQGVPYNPNEVGANGAPTPVGGILGRIPGHVPGTPPPGYVPGPTGAPLQPGGAPAAPQTAQAPQGAPALPGGIDPFQLARQGAMSELFGFPNVAAPMLQAYYNSPEYIRQKALAEAQAQNQVKLQYAGPVKQAEAQFTAVRPSGSFPVFDKQGHVTGWQQAPAAPVVEPNAGVVVQPNSGATTPIGGNYTQGVQNVATAKAAGPAAFKEVNLEGPYGQGYSTSALNFARGINGGAGGAPIAPNVVPGTNMATNLPVPGAPPQGAAAASPAQQRIEAAAPTFPVQTPTGPKDISQVSLGDLFPGGKGIPAPPAPPPGMTYGKPSETVTEMQKDDAERATGYAKEASENQKIYQDLAHLKDIIQSGVTTSTLAPAMAELGNVAQGLGAGSLVPNKFDPNDLAVFNKASTDLVFAAVKKLAGAVKVAEIEGYRQASPSMTMPPGANLNVINDLLSQGKWQDVRSNLATQYLTQTGGAPLAAFDTRFNQMAPLVDVTEAYKAEMRKTPQYQQGLAHGIGLPEDLRAAGTNPAVRAGMPPGMTLKRTLNGTDYYSSGDGTWHHYSQ